MVRARSRTSGMTSVAELVRQESRRYREDSWKGLTRENIEVRLACDP
jgi:hypothetical protein